MKRANAVLFDLDGTLVDTAPDLVAALNAVLKDYQQPLVLVSKARVYASHGAMGLLTYGFNIKPNDAKMPELTQTFLTYYRKAICDKSKLFDGMDELLHTLEAKQCSWGVVTNKMASLTEPLLKKMQLFDRAHVVVSGDTTSERKPSPKPLLHACELGGLDPKSTLYVGDDPRDIQAAIAASMPSVAVRYGYYDSTENPDNWGANWVINHPSELLTLLDLSN